MTEIRDETWWHAEASRSLKLADGATGTITMTNWHWSILDWLKDAHGWSQRMIMDVIDVWDDWNAGPSEKLAFYIEYAFEILLAEQEGREPRLEVAA